MGLIFSKRVRKFGPTDHRKGKNWSESDVSKGKRASNSGKFIAEGLGRLWTRSRPLKKPLKNRSEGFPGTGYVTPGCGGRGEGWENRSSACGFVCAF